MTVKVQIDIPAAGVAGAESGDRNAHPADATVRLDHGAIAAGFVIAARSSEGGEPILCGGGEETPQFALSASDDRAIVVRRATS